MITKHLKLSIRQRGMSFDGTLDGAIANAGNHNMPNWWTGFKRQLEGLGFTVEEVEAAPSPELLALAAKWRATATELYEAHSEQVGRILCLQECAEELEHAVKGTE
jgi:hypothetical protein